MQYGWSYASNLTPTPIWLPTIPWCTLYCKRKGESRVCRRYVCMWFTMWMYICPYKYIYIHNVSMTPFTYLPVNGCTSISSTYLSICLCTDAIKILLGHHKYPSSFPKLRSREDITQLPNDEILLNSSESAGHLRGWWETWSINWSRIRTYLPIGLFLHISTYRFLMLCVPSGNYLVTCLFIYLPTGLHTYLLKYTRK